MVPSNQGSQSALQTSTTLPLLFFNINIIIINILFHFTAEEPEAQKERMIFRSHCIEEIMG